MKNTIICALVMVIISCATESDREKKVRESKENLQHTLDSIDRASDKKMRQINDTIKSLESGATLKELRR